MIDHDSFGERINYCPIAFQKKLIAEGRAAETIFALDRDSALAALAHPKIANGNHISPELRLVIPLALNALAYG